MCKVLIKIMRNTKDDSLIECWLNNVYYNLYIVCQRWCVINNLQAVGTASMYSVKISRQVCIQFSRYSVVKLQNN